jgi:hypothetical protein
MSSQSNNKKEPEEGKKVEKKKKSLSGIFAAIPRRLSTASKCSNKWLPSKVAGEENYFLAIREIFDFLVAYRLLFSFLDRNHFQKKVPTVLGPAISMTIKMVTKMPKRKRIVVSPAARRLDSQVRISKQALTREDV